MGLLDGLTDLKNFFTGGGAELSVAIQGECYLRKPFLVETSITIGDSDITAGLVYLHLKYMEQVEASGSAYDSSGNSSSETFHENTILYQDKIILEDKATLKANQTYNFENEITLPIEVFPSFKGINAELVWSLQAVINKDGNNPESEKLVFEPKFEIV